MTLREQLDADLRASMRVGDETRKQTLRLLITTIRNAEIPPEPAEAGGERQRLSLDDDDVLNLIRKEVKQRRDSFDAYTKAGRPDLAAKEEAEVEVLATYLPAQLARDDVVAVAQRIIEQVGAKGPADKGRVMPLVMAELRERAEGREINAVVTELLSS